MGRREMIKQDGRRGKKRGKENVAWTERHRPALDVGWPPVGAERGGGEEREWNHMVLRYEAKLLTPRQHGTKA